MPIYEIRGIQIDAPSYDDASDFYNAAAEIARQQQRQESSRFARQIVDNEFGEDDIVNGTLDHVENSALRRARENLQRIASRGCRIVIR